MKNINILFLALLCCACRLITYTKALKTMMEEYKARPISKYYTKEYSEKGSIDVKGEVRRVGNSKIVSVSCHMNIPKSRPILRWVIWWIMWWRAKPDSSPKMIGGSFFHDGPIMGRNNIRWQHRKDLLNKLKPHLLCAVENQNAESYLKSNNSGDYLRMYFIMDKCDPPGVFRCEALIKSYNVRSHEVPLYGEFKAGETSDGRVDPKCKEGKKHKEEKKKYLQLYDSLPDFYMHSMRRDFLKSDHVKGDPLNWPAEGGYTIMNAKFSEKGGLRFMELQCKVNIRKVKKKVELVKEFYFFYQPEEDWPNARVILAGLVRDKGLWVDPYRIRMFPQLRILLDKHKGMIWRGSEGSGKRAVFTITIPMDLCDTLKGAFQCQAKIAAHGFSSKKYTMVRGWYKLKDTPFSSKSKNCNAKKELANTAETALLLDLI
ncbi:uncharacterized protein LOC125648095 isoform X5 [Ostrea edulis]|uniref:uncharacterized protein LOC125648095 isoform X5 n=1 Tax=Ostrea edulis TaxID=37623 RepID=UPI002094B939|nr:uncharacterized protein LOC125648095 isoform X5 [Ostrea edulis]